MTARSLFFCVSFVMVKLLSGQEDPLHPEAKPSPAAAAPPVTSAATPLPSATAPQFTDVLFKNLKARAIGPAVMGGRISDIGIDPRHPFGFYVGLARGRGFKTGDNWVSVDPTFRNE